MKRIYTRRSLPVAPFLLDPSVGLNESLASQFSRASDGWPRWAGRVRDEIGPDEYWGQDLSEESLGVKWRVDGLQPSCSAPVVDSDQIYITEAVDKTGTVVRALNRFSGVELWRKKVRWEATPEGHGTSPVVIDGFAYLFLKSRRFGCIDLETGEQAWASPLTGDTHWALATQGKRILSLSDSGALRLIGADPKGYTLLSERQVFGGENRGQLAAVGGQVFVRSGQSLIALNWL